VHSHQRVNVPGFMAVSDQIGLPQACASNEQPTPFVANPNAAAQHPLLGSGWCWLRCSDELGAMVRQVQWWVLTPPWLGWDPGKPTTCAPEKHGSHPHTTASPTHTQTAPTHTARQHQHTHTHSTNTHTHTQHQHTARDSTNTHAETAPTHSQRQHQHTHRDSTNTHTERQHQHTERQHQHTQKLLPHARSQLLPHALISNLLTHALISNYCLTLLSQLLPHSHTHSPHTLLPPHTRHQLPLAGLRQRRHTQQATRSECDHGVVHRLQVSISV